MAYRRNYHNAPLAMDLATVIQLPTALKTSIQSIRAADRQRNSAKALAQTTTLTHHGQHPTQADATAHLAKWEPLRPISDRGLISWAQEQHDAYSVPHHGGPRPHTATLVWMSWECARLRTSPGERDEPPMPPPAEAICAWEYQQTLKKRAEVAKTKAKEAKEAKMKVIEAMKELERKEEEAKEAAVMAKPMKAPIPEIRCKRPVAGAKALEKAETMSTAPKVLRKLPLYSGVAGIPSKSAPAPVATTKAEDQVVVSSATGGLHFYRADHDESKCEFCRTMRKNSE